MDKEVHQMVMVEANSGLLLPDMDRPRRHDSGRPDLDLRNKTAEGLANYIELTGLPPHGDSPSEFYCLNNSTIEQTLASQH